MAPVLSIILIVILAWAGSVSLATGRIYLRSGATSKGWMPRAFGGCLVLAATILALDRSGHLPASFHGAVTPVIAGLLVLAVALQAIF